MDPAIPDPVNWYTAIPYGIAVFTALTLGINKYLDMKGGHQLKLKQLEENYNFQLARAEKADERAREYELKERQTWELLNNVKSEMSEIKAQNRYLMEQVEELRYENKELKAWIQDKKGKSDDSPTA